MSSEAEINNLIVRLTGDGSSYQKMLTQAQMSTERTATSVEAATKRIEGMQSGLQNFASGAVGVLAGFGLATSLQGAFKAADDLEDANRRLNASIEASGRTASTVREDYVAFAKSLTDVTTVSIKEVMSLIEQAERMQITGDAAKRMAQNAVAFAAIQNTSASEGMRAARALEMGNTMQLKFALGLRGVSDEAKINAIAQQRLAAGWKVALDRAEDVSGLIEKLQRTFKGLGIEVGQVIAEAITPAVKWLLELGETFKRLNPESKKLVTMIAVVAIALAGLGPLTSTLLFVLAPLGAAFGFVAAAVGFLLTPFGLAAAAVIAAGAWLIDTGTVVTWFGEQWVALKNYIQPAIDGIKAAFAAGDIVLAAKIMWAQIKLTFNEAIGPLKEMWISFTSALATMFFDALAAIQTKFEETSTNLQNIMVWLKYKTGQITFEEGKAEIERLGAALNAQLNTIEAERKAAVDVIKEQTAQDIKAARDALNGLRKDRDALVNQAKEEAAKIPAKVPLKLDPKIPKIPTQTANVKMKFDAAAFASAEARGRIAEFMEKLEHPEDFKRNKRGGGIAVGKFEAARAGGIEAEDRQDRQNDFLARIAAGVENLVQKPVMPVVPADL